MKKSLMHSYINARGISHSFIATAIGGVFLILSGLLTDPNTGRAITGILIASRGIISESCRRFLQSKNYQEATSALPGMGIAALMN